MTYTQYKAKGQKEFDSLPIFFAFNNRQFKEEMEKRGLTENDTDQVYRLGDCGGFYLKKDADEIRGYFNREDDLPKLMNDVVFAVGAFFYEMKNHEYAINWQGDWDVCSCFGDCEYGAEKDYRDYLKEMGYSDTVVGYYKTAKKKYNLDCEENGWY